MGRQRDSRPRRSQTGRCTALLWNCRRNSCHACCWGSGRPLRGALDRRRRSTSPICRAGRAHRRRPCGAYLALSAELRLTPVLAPPSSQGAASVPPRGAVAVAGGGTAGAVVGAGVGPVPRAGRPTGDAMQCWLQRTLTHVCGASPLSSPDADESCGTLRAYMLADVPLASWVAPGGVGGEAESLSGADIPHRRSFDMRAGLRAAV